MTMLHACMHKTCEPTQSYLHLARPYESSCRTDDSTTATEVRKSCAPTTHDQQKRPSDPRPQTSNTTVSPRQCKACGEDRTDARLRSAGNAPPQKNRCRHCTHQTSVPFVPRSLIRDPASRGTVPCAASPAQGRLGSSGPFEPLRKATRRQHCAARAILPQRLAPRQEA